MANLLVLSFTAITASSSGQPSIGCIDGKGALVDYWYTFKYPDCWDYAYMAEGLELKKAGDELSSDSSPMSKTLAQLYGNHTKLSYALWNDRHSDGKEVLGPHAHAKGVLAFDGNSGFWLTHSLPRFPGTMAQGGPTYFGASHKYGQNFLCITINHESLKSIAELFNLDELSIYDSADNANAGGDFKRWAVDLQYDKKATTHVTTVTSAGGNRFTSFAKTAKWDDALWDSFVAPYYKLDFYTETWQNGLGKMASKCTGITKVQNLKSVNFPGASWRETQDHSKWAVSTKGSVFCVGDINRQTKQVERGGGAVCTENQALVKQMLSRVGGVEPCKSISSAPVMV